MYAIIPRPTNWISHAAHPRGMVNVVSWCAAPMLVFMGLAQFAPPSLAEVIVTEWDDPVVEEFDPDNPPTDPPIAEGEDADAMPRVDWEGGANNGTWNSATNTYTVTTLGDITLSGHTDIRVPNNATEELREHENGHDRLNKHEYEQRAKRKMEDAFRRFVGSSFVGEGETDADRQEDARTKAAEERDKRANRATDGILKQMDTLNGKYDKLTEHGTSDDIDTAEGETQAKEEQDKAPKAGDEPKKPDESEQDSGAGVQPGSAPEGRRRAHSLDPRPEPARPLWARAAPPRLP